MKKHAFPLPVLLTISTFLVACGGGSGSTSSGAIPSPSSGGADTTAPRITLLGSSPMTLSQGEIFSDPGASASDDLDPSVTLTSSGTVDTGTVGTYSITYTAVDAANNTSTLTRIVTVFPGTSTPYCSSFESIVDFGPLVAATDCGLQYRQHAALGETQEIHILPDFSHAGYQGGGVPIPDIPSVITLTPLPGVDDTQQIQDAIDQVSLLPPDSNGFRGAIELSSGEFDISSRLEITISGVILRGAGQGSLANGGTVLRAKTSIDDQFILFKGTRNFSTDNASRVKISTDYVPVGASAFDVVDASGFSVGDTIAVRRTPNDQWLSVTGMDSIISGNTDESWRASSYHITHLRTITAISGNRLNIDIPIVDSMQTALGGGDVALVTTNQRLQFCGIEDLRLISDYTSDIDENHAWDAVQIENAEHCWVRRVTALHFAFAVVHINNASFNTIEEVAIRDLKSTTRGGRRYPFNINGQSVGNFFQRCYASDGRHNFVTGSRVTGPNVWLDCLAENSINDDGPHHRWASGLLYDNIETLQLHVQNRYSSGSGHGWSGVQIAFWNSAVTSSAANSSIPKSPSIIVDAPYSALNWAVGITGDGPLGTSTRIANQPQGVTESFGHTVVPRSLYLAQLEDRLGASAVEAIAIPEQQQGRIWDALRAWKGEGKLADFL